MGRLAWQRSIFLDDDEKARSINTNVNIIVMMVDGDIFLWMMCLCIDFYLFCLGVRGNIGLKRRGRRF